MKRMHARFNNYCGCSPALGVYLTVVTLAAVVLHLITGR